MRKLLLIFLLFPSLCFANKWECINKAIAMCNTWRMEVPTGWIVASDNSATSSEHTYAMVFVPDENHRWKV